MNLVQYFLYIEQSCNILYENAHSETYVFISHVVIYICSSTYVTKMSRRPSQDIWHFEARVKFMKHSSCSLSQISYITYRDWSCLTDVNGKYENVNILSFFCCCCFSGNFLDVDKYYAMKNKEVTPLIYYHYIIIYCYCYLTIASL